MKRILLLSVLILKINFCYSINYFVSNGGNDAFSGTNMSSPWKTLQKVNTNIGSINAGDTIFFKKGDTFNGYIDFWKAGNANNPIVIAAYGNGPLPIIDGSIPSNMISNWQICTTCNSGIYVSTVQVTINNHVTSNSEGMEGPIAHAYSNERLMQIARFPNVGLLTITGTTIPDNAAFVSNQILKNAGALNGAKVRFRIQRWMYATQTIATHTGSSLFFTGNTGPIWKPTIGWGFYIDGKLSELDAENEWVFEPINTTSGRVFIKTPSGIHPTLFKLDFSYWDYGIRLSSGSNYISINNIEFRHQKRASIGSHTSTTRQGIVVQNCTFAQVYSAIALDGAQTNASNNIIKNVLNNGIELKNSTNSIVDNNTLDHTGYMPGYAQSQTQQGGNSVILINCAYSRVTQNIIDSAGYSGIQFVNTNMCKAENNIVSNYNYVLDDGAALYIMSSTGINTFTGNICINGIGNGEGVAGGGTHVAGIYLDQFSSNMLVTNNTVNMVKDYGLQINSSKNHQILNNVFYGGSKNILFNDFPDGSSVQEKCFGNTIVGNTLAVNNEDAVNLHFNTSYQSVDTMMAVFRNNSIFQPFDMHTITRRIQGANQYFSLQKFRTLRSKYNSTTNGHTFMNWSSYKFDTLSNNLISNGQFNNSLAGWSFWPPQGRIRTGINTSVGINNNALLYAYTTSGSNFTTSNNLNLTSTDWYLLRFTNASSRADSFNLIEKSSNVNWNAVQDYSINKYLYSSNSPIEYRIKWQPKFSGNVSRVFWMPLLPDSLMVLDNISLHKASFIDQSKEYLQIFTNNNTTTSTISLGTKKYLDAFGKKVSDKIVLKPRSLQVLMLDATSITGLYISAGPETQELSNANQTVNVTISSNVMFTISGLKEWAAVNQSEGDNNMVISLNLQSNTSPLGRNMVLSILGSQGLKTFININQKGIDQSSVLGLNYKKAFQNMFYYFEGQQSGKLSPNNRVNFRGPSNLTEGHLHYADNFDISGGWYDAGDSWKSNQTMSNAALDMSLSMLYYPIAYQNTQQMDKALENLWYLNEYFKKCIINKNTSNPQDELKVIIGTGYVGIPNGGQSQNNAWGPYELEDYNIATGNHIRSIFLVDKETPGSDIPAQMSAVMAASSVLFRKYGNVLAQKNGFIGKNMQNYSDTLLDLSQKLYLFANANRTPTHLGNSTCAKRYQNRTFTGVCGLGYRSTTYDKLQTAAPLIFMANKEKNSVFSDSSWIYRADTIRRQADYFTELRKWYQYNQSWHQMASILMIRCLPTSKTAIYHQDIMEVISLFADAGTVKEWKRTRNAAGVKEKGMSYHKTNNDFLIQRMIGNAEIALWYSDLVTTTSIPYGSTWIDNYVNGGKTTLQLRNAYRQVAEENIQYVLGNNPKGTSYMMGFDSPFLSGNEDWSKITLHRTAKGNFWGNDNENLNCCPLDRNAIFFKARNTYYGAINAGPDSLDRFEDIPSLQSSNPLQAESNLYYSHKNSENMLNIAGPMTGCLAWLIAQNKGVGSEATIFPPQFVKNESNDVYWTDKEFFAQAAIVAETPKSLRLRVRLNNRSRWPAKITDTLEYKYYIKLDPNCTLSQYTIVTHSGSAGLRYTLENECDSVVSIRVSYNAIIFAPTRAVMKLGTVTSYPMLSYQDNEFTISCTGIDVNFKNDWSYQNLTSLTSALQQPISNQIAVFENNRKLGGYIPANATMLGANVFSHTITNNTNCGESLGIIKLYSAHQLDYSINSLEWKSDQTYTNLPTGVYTVQARLSHKTNCKSSEQFVQISQPLSPNISALSENIMSCHTTLSQIIVLSTSSGISEEYKINQGDWQSSPEFGSLAQGTYTVYARNANAKNCVSTTKSIEISSFDCTSILPIEQIPATYIYPNPSDGDYVYLSTYDWVELKNIHGAVCLKSEYTNKLFVRNLLPGVYILKINGNSYKWIKQ